MGFCCMLSVIRAQYANQLTPYTSADPPTERIAGHLHQHVCHCLLWDGRKDDPLKPHATRWSSHRINKLHIIWTITEFRRLTGVKRLTAIWWMKYFFSTNQLTCYKKKNLYSKKIHIKKLEPGISRCADLYKCRHFAVCLWGGFRCVQTQCR